MLACESGSIDILVHFLDSIFAMNIKTTDIRDLLLSHHFNVFNDKGESAISLLSAYYNKNPKKIKSFLKKAVGDKFYLLELVSNLF